MPGNESIEVGVSDRISVCICTYKRPELLRAALNAIAHQTTQGRFSLEIIVVDNDGMRSAQSVVKEFQEHNEVRIVYDCEPEQSISLARNRCIVNAKGNLIAFIDDDEVPEGDWLLRLYIAIRRYGADGALGPVLPSYQPNAPDWLKKTNVFGRRRFATGTRLTVRDTRTGNALLVKGLFNENETWFDPAFGRTGGEDVDFFGRHLARGRIFVWCDEAVVHETIPPERCETSFHVKKYFRIGALNGERLRTSRVVGIIELAKTAILMPGWLNCLILLLPFGKHRWILPALKFCYCCGCVLAYVGLSLARYRD